ncbi:MAG: hypothetical protein KA354_14300 [Phycisphaerae bacterium]|nr:hypothetical protein [Phycisphaerae bacterium]
MRTPNVMMVMARCAGSKQGFGLKFKRKWWNKWVAIEAFPLAEAVTNRGGYGQAAITGSIVLDSPFQGCPYCGNPNIFRCGCGKVFCWDGKSRIVTCPWCGQTGELSGILDTLTACEDL